ncbi:MAG: TIGR00266 family protein [Pseudomonadota bacterium]
MQSRVELGPSFSILVIYLEQGESIRAEPGAMVSMSPSIELKTKLAGGGLWGAVKAKLGGESAFGSIYTATSGPGELVLAPATPGDIMQLDLGGNTIYAQGGAYLAGNPDLEISASGSLKAMFSGEGLFLAKISGNGPVFLTSYGGIYQRHLEPGQKYVVDTGHIVAFEQTVTYELKKAAKGWISSAVSGEGLVCQYCGPGNIWIQTRNLPAFASMIRSITGEK